MALSACQGMVWGDLKGDGMAKGNFLYLSEKQMADPNRDRKAWKTDQAKIAAQTGFKGQIKRSKIYDAPDWDGPHYNSTA